MREVIHVALISAYIKAGGGGLCITQQQRVESCSKGERLTGQEEKKEEEKEKKKRDVE